MKETAMSPKRIQRRRTKGWRLPDGAVIVARPSRWGNPFRIGSLNPVEWMWRDNRWNPYPEATDWILTREDAVAAFRRIARQPDYAAAVRTALAGFDLACFCPPSQPCHADVLLELANPGVGSHRD